MLTRPATSQDLTFAELTRTHLVEPEVIRRGEGEPQVVGDTTVRSLFAAADRRRFELAEGDAVRFAAELDHVHVTGEAGCRVLTLISFSED